RERRRETPAGAPRRQPAGARRPRGRDEQGAEKPRILVILVATECGSAAGGWPTGSGTSRLSAARRLRLPGRGSRGGRENDRTAPRGALHLSPPPSARGGR